MPKYKATAYIRLSYTDDHSSESDSVSNQRKLIENFVERNPDIEVVSEKIDDGYSGIIFDRPAFKEMMQDVTDGNINCVIVKDLSRLGREYIETGRYLRRVFPAYGVRFIAITDSIDMCLAVWLGLSANDVAGRLLGLFFPIMCFVAIGYEHSIANMFFIPLGMMHGASVTVSDFLLANLVPATLGNIAGGAVFVGGIYWYINK